MPVLYLVSVVGIVFVSCFFAALCRDPGGRKTFDVWYIRGGVRRNWLSKRTANNVRRAA